MSDDKKHLIRKQGVWYRPNSQGYTSSAIQAGRFSLVEAQDITHPNGWTGPRDGMDWVHEDHVADDDWIAYRNQTAEIDRLTKALAVVLFEYDDVDIAEGEPPSMTAAINQARAALNKEPTQ